ncbi:hypothetical protein FH969_08120 [Miniimonas arenae]|uniref:G domain-containing protein n=1 Tax=Miniimonas arenae TaxID=676201 RepID=A0A5C5BBC9_9MICO|nr:MULTISPECIES: GTPase [Miniimonas]TNU74099.1 hypothetical protein FH969_08120 [Miniimonas arenae]
MSESEITGGAPDEGGGAEPPSTQVTDASRARATHAAHAGGDAREVARRAELLDVLGAFGTRLPADVAARARAELDAVGGRLALGVAHRVVALVGGTGSGKSSLFNAVTGLEVADVGVVRPTTALPTACMWGSDATALLDHLDVPRDRRYRGETALAGPEPGQLDGVVLLDVPDHDSVAAGHRDQVDRLVPLVDLLVWVLDPQKYADERLHAGYLRGLAGRQDAMLVVVNQIDTLTPEGLTELRLDVARLLVAEGLGGVEVLTTSARTGDGVAELREAVQRVSQRASVNRTAAWDQLDSVSRALTAGLGPRPGADVDVPAAAARLAEAAGVGVVADSLAAAVRGGVAVTAVRDVPQARLEAIRHEWVATLTDGLAPAWRDAVAGAVPPARAIGEAVTAALREVPVPAVARPGLFARLRSGAVAAAADQARDGYLAATTPALESCVQKLLAPAQDVRASLAEAHRVLDGAR